MVNISGACVALPRQTLAEYGITPALKSAITKIAENIPRHDHRVSYSLNGSGYHCQVENQIIYICVTDGDDKIRVVYSFLDDVKEKFKQTFSSINGGYPRPENLNPPLCSKFGSTIASRVRYFNENPEADKISKIQAQIDDVKEVMLQNIEDVIQRGENIDNLVDTTGNLFEEATQFEDNSRTLRKAMWWKNCKLILMILGVLLLIAFIITWFACGIDFSKCSGGKDDDKKDDSKLAPAPAPAPAPTPAPAPEDGQASREGSSFLPNTTHTKTQVDDENSSTT